MAKKVKEDKCPHCNDSYGFYKTSLYRVRQEFFFDEPDSPNDASYTFISGGRRMQCLKCHKQIELELDDEE